MMPARKPNRGSFRAGPDKRRHRFTQQEQSRGFYAALQGGAPYHWLLFRVRGGAKRKGDCS